MKAIYAALKGADFFVANGTSGAVYRYGTTVCVLERRRPAILLPDREWATAEAWLADHREIAIVARGRGGGYGEAVARALPHAEQVADR